MTHMIEDNKAFYVGKPAWHGLGTVLTDAPSTDDAWKIAYPHNILELKSFAGIDSNTLIEDLESKYLVRDDGKILGRVGADYELVQPYEAFNYYNPLMESGLVTLEAGGSLYDGKRMWALAAVNGAYADITPGDAVKAYLLLATSFDGSLAMTIKFTGTRVVCDNTLQIALGESSAISLKSRHTRNIRIRMEDTRRIVEKALKGFNLSVEAYRALAAKPATYSKLVSYVQNVIIPDDTDRDKLSGKMKAKVQNVVDLIEDQRGLDLVPASRGSMWQGYNAVTEYVTHHAGRNEDTRLNGQWFGESANLNQRALDMALAA